jgi:hypothetical protein
MEMFLGANEGTNDDRRSVNAGWPALIPDNGLAVGIEEKLGFVLRAAFFVFNGCWVRFVIKTLRPVSSGQ